MGAACTGRELALAPGRDPDVRNGASGVDLGRRPCQLCAVLSANAYIQKWQVAALGVILLILIAMFAVFISPGLLSGRKLVGTPTSGAIFSDGGWHCPGDGPNRIHYHSCAGEAVPLPPGTRPSDFPNTD